MSPARRSAEAHDDERALPRASGSEGGAFQSKLSIVGSCNAMKRISSAPFMPGAASGSMWMWKAPPTRGSISASGAKNLSMPARVVQLARPLDRRGDDDLLVERALGAPWRMRVPEPGRGRQRRATFSNPLAHGGLLGRSAAPFAGSRFRSRKAANSQVRMPTSSVYGVRCSSEAAGRRGAPGRSLGRPGAAARPRIPPGSADLAVHQHDHLAFAVEAAAQVVGGDVLAKVRHHRPVRRQRKPLATLSR